jgi:hypothetical protein
MRISWFMSLKTVRLDADAERDLAAIQRATGCSASAALKAGLARVRSELDRSSSARPFEIYQQIELGPGGYARAPARRAKQAIRAVLKAKRAP